MNLTIHSCSGGFDSMASNAARGHLISSHVTGKPKKLNIAKTSLSLKGKCDNADHRCSLLDNSEPKKFTWIDTCDKQAWETSPLEIVKSHSYMYMYLCRTIARQHWDRKSFILKMFALLSGASSPRHLISTCFWLARFCTMYKYM